MVRDEAIAKYSSNSSMVMVAGQLAELERKEQVIGLAIASVVIGVFSLCIGIGSLIQGIMSTVSETASKQDVNARKKRLAGVLKTLNSSTHLWAKQVKSFNGRMEKFCGEKDCDVNKSSIEATEEYQNALSTFKEFENRLRSARDTVEKVKADFALGPPETPFNGSAWFNNKWKDMFPPYHTGQKSHLWLDFKGDTRGIKGDVYNSMYRLYAKNSWGWASDAVQHIHELWESKEKSMTITEDLALEYNGRHKQGVCGMGDACPCDSGWDAGCPGTRRCLACENGAASDAIFGSSKISDHAGKAVEDVHRSQTNLFQIFQTATIAFNFWNDSIDSAPV